MRFEEPPFQLEGPEGDAFVWTCSSGGREVRCHNLRQRDQFAEVLSVWLAANGYDERG